MEWNDTIKALGSLVTSVEEILMFNAHFKLHEQPVRVTEQRHENVSSEC